MSTFKNLAGLKFNYLTVIEPIGQDYRYKTIWKCRCDCGKTTTVISSDLRSGRKKSCGCLKNKTSSGKYNYKNQKRQYTIYYGMKARCYKKSSRKYKDYGARGIIICDEWLNSFDAFCEWALSNGYSENLSIDRINNNGNYEPSNCRWATSIIQGKNTRSTRLLTFEGKTLPMSQWAKKLNMTPSSLKRKIDEQHLTLEQIINDL